MKIKWICAFFILLTLKTVKMIKTMIKADIKMTKQKQIKN